MKRNGKHIIGSKAQTAGEIIAQGQSTDLMQLPDADPKEISSILGAPESTLTNILATIGDDDEEGIDTNAFVWDDDNIFSRFSGKRKKPKTKPTAPTADFVDLPNGKTKNVTENDNFVFDHSGEAYQYLGQWDGDLSFLDEQAKNIALPPPGSFLYRKPTGLTVDDKVQFEYSTGVNPNVSNFGGRNPKFKVIGKKFVKGEISNFVMPTINNSAVFTRTAAPGAPITDPYYNLKNNVLGPSLSSLKLSPYGQNLLNQSNQSPIPSGISNLFKNSFQTIPGTANYYNPSVGLNTAQYSLVGKPVADAAESNGEKGSGFKNVVDSIAGLLTPAAALITALKGNKVANGATPTDMSNGGGNTPAYIQSELNSGGGGGTQQVEYDEEQQARAYQDENGKMVYPPKSNSNKSLIYLAIAAAVIGVIVYLKRKK